MKKLKLIPLAVLTIAALFSCKKTGANDENSTISAKNAQLASTKTGLSASAAAVSWVNVIPANSFDNFSTYWSNFYPWGIDHNGSARMVAQNITTSGGVLTLKSVPGTVADKASIHYLSGTVYAKAIPVVDNNWPKWHFSGEFQCESQRGTWPAFWITGADSWPPESDFMEFKGSNTCWTNTYKNESGNWSSVGTPVSNPGAWHLYSVYVTKISDTNVSIEYWIDGVKKSVQTGGNFVGKRFWIIIDYQMEGSSGAPGPNATTYMRARNVIVEKSATL